MSKEHIKGLSITEKQYLIEVKKTNKNPDFNDEEMKSNFEICLFEELGEVAGVLKKFVFHKHNKDETKEKLTKEIGDVLWYSFALSILYERENEIKFHHPTWDEIKTNNDLVVHVKNYINYHKQTEFGVFNPSLINDIIIELAHIITYFNCDINYCVECNVEKLVGKNGRYKNGFSFEDSRDRV